LTTPLETFDTDVLVVGGGLAALRAAYDAAGEGARVALAVKGRAGRSGSSAMTSAGYSAWIRPDDSPERHYQDTVAGGRGLTEPRLAEALAREAPLRRAELVELGGRLAQLDGEPAIHASGDHSVPRTVVAENFKGLDFTIPLLEAVQRRGVQLLERTATLDLLTRDGEIEGAVCLRYAEPGGLLRVECGAVILAAGGAGQLFAVTSNTSDVTGDGYALALRAGAAVRDMEFIQFYPWRCIVPFSGTRMPIQPSTFVLGARLYNRRSERFMDDYDPVKHEATTRDLAARAIYQQIAANLDVKGGVRLDVSELTEEQWVRSNPKPARYFLDRGIDFHDQEMILSPEAHFFMGGVVVDEWGARRVPGLFVAGETAGGLHGANRLDSNAIPETQVFGARAGRAAAARAIGTARRGGDQAWAPRWASAGDRDHADGDLAEYERMRRRLKETAWLRLGIVRDGDGLRAGLREVRRLGEELGSRSPGSPRALLAHSELASSLLTAEACFTAALHRRESRGAHFRSDFPDQDPAWSRPSVLGLGPDGPVLEDAPFLESPPGPAPRAAGDRPAPPHEEVSDD
jgi:fumarate reductase (CoM/CoB) subunit A